MYYSCTTDNYVRIAHSLRARASARVGGSSPRTGMVGIGWHVKEPPPPISSQLQYSAYKTECGFRSQSGNAYVQALELP